MLFSYTDDQYSQDLVVVAETVTVTPDDDTRQTQLLPAFSYCWDRWASSWRLNMHKVLQADGSNTQQSSAGQWRSQSMVPEGLPTLQSVN